MTKKKGKRKKREKRETEERETDRSVRQKRDRRSTAACRQQNSCCRQETLHVSQFCPSFPAAEEENATNKQRRDRKPHTHTHLCADVPRLF